MYPVLSVFFRLPICKCAQVTQFPVWPRRYIPALVPSPSCWFLETQILSLDYNVTKPESPYLTHIWTQPASGNIAVPSAARGSFLRPRNSQSIQQSPEKERVFGAESWAQLPTFPGL